MCFVGFGYFVNVLDLHIGSHVKKEQQTKQTKKKLKGFYGQPDADNMGLQNAGPNLLSRFGEAAKWVWGIGW